jgi:hypothetical protein
MFELIMNSNQNTRGKIKLVFDRILGERGRALHLLKVGAKSRSNMAKRTKKTFETKR